MTHEQSENLLALASRNAMILLWLRDLDESKRDMDPIIARAVARQYADATGMPLCEVEGALSHLTDSASLDWLWTHYEADIRAADFLRP